jgi:hypothetical protein
MPARTTLTYSSAENGANTEQLHVYYCKFSGRQVFPYPHKHQGGYPMHQQCGTSGTSISVTGAFYHHVKSDETPKYAMERTPSFGSTVLTTIPTNISHLPPPQIYYVGSA